MNKRIKLICLSCFMLFTMLSCSSGKSPETRFTNGNLLPCPSTPNCVSSQADDENHHVAPIPIPADKAVDIHQILINALGSIKGVVIVDNSENNIHAIFKTKLLRFKDDVDFFIDRENGIIHLRSASRTGYSDFGVNRKRVEKLRKMIADEME